MSFSHSVSGLLQRASTLYGDPSAQSKAAECFTELQRESNSAVGAVYKKLWELKGSPLGNPEFGKHCFHAIGGLESSATDKARALAYCLNGTEVNVNTLSLSDVLYRTTSTDQYVKVGISAREEHKEYEYHPGSVDDLGIGNDSSYGPAYRWAFEPRGSYPHWPSRTWPSWTEAYDCRDEVATPDRPAQLLPNDTAWRAVPGVDYSKLGFVKIGTIWVEKTNPRDIDVATKREAQANKTYATSIGETIASGVAWAAEAMHIKIPNFSAASSPSQIARMNLHESSWSSPTKPKTLEDRFRK